MKRKTVGVAGPKRTVAVGADRWVLADGGPGEGRTVRRSAITARRRLHFAKFVRADGAVSALCFTKPRAIDLRRASWTLRRHATTCPACIGLLALNPALDAPAMPGAATDPRGAARRGT